MATINGVEVAGDKSAHDFGLLDNQDKTEIDNSIERNREATEDNHADIVRHRTDTDVHVTPEWKNSLVTKEILGLYWTAAQTADIINEISIAGGAKLVKVDVLPAVGLEQTIYLVPKTDPQAGDVFDEYVWVDGKYEFIGTTKANLSNYYTKVEIDYIVSQLDIKYIKSDDTTIVKLTNLNEINLQEDHYNAWFGYRGGKVTNWKFGDGTEGGLADVYVKDLYLGDKKLSDLLGDKAKDADVVHLTGSETVDGTKTFTSSPRVRRVTPDIALNISDCDVTETPTEAKSATLYFRDKNNKNLSYVVSQQRTNGEKRMCLRTHRTDNIDNYYSVDLDSEGNFYPEQQQMKLGTSSYKWADVNTVLLNGKTPETIEEQGDGYIRYSNGLQICWGSDTNISNIEQGITQINFAKGFSLDPVVVINIVHQTDTLYYVCQAHGITTTYFRAYCYLVATTLRTPDQFLFSWQAIGRWK